MLVGKITPGEAQLCADQGLTRRLNRIFDYRGLSYAERPKIAAVLQSNAGCSPAAEACEETAVGPSTKRKCPEWSPKAGRTKKAVALRKKPREAAPEVFHAETSPEGSAASRDMARRESSEGAQEVQAPKSLFCSRVDLPTLILSDDEELTETGAITEPAVQEEPAAEGGDDVEVAAYSSPASPSSSSSETEDSTPSAPRRRGKGLMGLGGLLDAKAIAPEALRPAAFEPSIGEVSDAKKMFGTFVLPELEILLA
jgi:hypothetical protein